MHLLRLKPIYKTYLWGGRRFRTDLGRPLDPGGTFAESWEVSDHGPEQSVVQSGPLAGMTLHQLVTRFGEELLGRHHPQERFPLLLKYLDANQRLSVQVHPDDAMATRMGLADPGKTEAWYILAADPGSVIWAGFSRPVGRSQLREAVQAERLAECLHRFQPAAGQTVFLAAGTVHALGPGLLVAEIQQTSDNTFRLYDWGRLGPDGKPRPLHIEAGLEATDYRQGPVGPCRPEATDHEGVQRLVRCGHFVLDRWRLTSPQAAGGDSRCHILTVLEGAVQIEADPAGGPLNRGQTILVPAAVGPVRIAPGARQPAALLDAYLP